MFPSALALQVRTSSVSIDHAVRPLSWSHGRRGQLSPPSDEPTVTRRRVSPRFSPAGLTNPPLVILTRGRAGLDGYLFLNPAPFLAEAAEPFTSVVHASRSAVTTASFSLAPAGSSSREALASCSVAVIRFASASQSRCWSAVSFFVALILPSTSSHCFTTSASCC